MPRPKEFTVALTGADRDADEGRVLGHPARMIARARCCLPWTRRSLPGPAGDRRAAGGFGEHGVPGGQRSPPMVGGSRTSRKKRALAGRADPATWTGDRVGVQPTAGRRARWTLRLLEKHVIATEGTPDSAGRGRCSPRPAGPSPPKVNATASWRARRRPGCSSALTRPTRSW